MPSLIKIMRLMLWRVLLFILLIAGVLWFFLSTTLGLKLALNSSNKFLPGTLHVQHVSGRLWKSMRFENLTYIEKNQTLYLDKAELTWHIQATFPLHITLDTLQLSQLSLKSDNKTALSLEKLILKGSWSQRNLQLNGHTNVLLPQGLLKADVRTNGKIITGHAVLGDNQFTIQGSLKGPWNIHAKLADLKRLDPSLAALKSTLIADATIDDMKHATLKAHLTPGEYILPQGSTPKSIAFRHAALDLNLTPKALNVDGHWHINQHITGNLALQLPGIRLDRAPPADQTINGDAHLNITSFDFLDEFIKLGEDGALIQNLTGKLHAVLHIKGILSKPTLTGETKLTNAHVTLPDLGLTLNPIDIMAKADAKNWETHALINTNNGSPLTLDGHGTFTPEISGSAIIHGENVILMSTPEYNLKASPNLTLTLSPKTYDVRGRILIPQALIAPIAFNHTEKLTHDAVFTDEEKDPNPFNLTADVLLDMGQDVRVHVEGIHGLIDGQLHFKQQPQQAPTAAGSLKLRDGGYEAYGQKLRIEQGELIFLGQQIDNPNIRVRAIRRFKQANAQFSGSNDLLDFDDSNLDIQNLGNNTTVGITVSGRIDSPRVKLFSKPPNISQANILSMLLLGKPADQASQSGSAILLQAMTSMHLDSGSKGLKTLQDLKKSAGIDFDVQNNTLGTRSSDVSKTSIMVGKSLTKRLYLRYNVGLFQENSSVLTLTYLLNKFLSIKVSTSDVGNGLDFVYSRSD